MGAATMAGQSPRVTILVPKCAAPGTIGRADTLHRPMRIHDQTAFVLHARPWRETSLLVEVLSADHGRLGLIARGVQ